MTKNIDCVCAMCMHEQSVYVESKQCTFACNSERGKLWVDVGGNPLEKHRSPDIFTFDVGVVRSGNAH